MTKGKQAAEVLGSAASDDWGTTPEVFKTLDIEFHFTLDPNADVTNHKCATYFTKEQNGLLQPWAPHRVYCNPPFSLNYEFIQKGKREANRGALVVFLIPARTQTLWFHEFVWDSTKHRPQIGVEVRFLKGRIPYIGTAGDGAPFPVMIIVFRPGLPL